MPAYTAAPPGADEYPAYFEGYVSLVPEGDVLQTLTRQIDDTLAALRAVISCTFRTERIWPGIFFSMLWH